MTRNAIDRCDQGHHAPAEPPDPVTCPASAMPRDPRADMLAALVAEVDARVGAAARWSVRERLPRLDAPAGGAPIRDIGGC